MKEELLELLKKYAYKKGDFKLSSGKTSKHYVNCKPVILSPRGLTLASVMLLSQVDKDAVAVGGLTLGADPLVSGVTVVCGLDNINLSGLIVRKKAKGHGTGAWIEGPELPEGSVVTVLEDVITTGGSSIEAVKRIRDAGYKVNRVVSIIDRQEDGEADAAMKWSNLELVSLYKLEELI
jgi:orotate phosphoribosyltransferase